MIARVLSLCLALSGVSCAHAPRPQAPVDRPYPHREVVLPGGAPGVRLAGELVLPAGAGPFPAALLIAGSGAQNRDEAVAGHRPFLVLADALARRGIASLRYDKRGVAASTGRFASATVADFARDADAALRWLAAEPGIDATRLAYVGHSEGGLVAPLAARLAPPGGPAAARLVLLAGPGCGMEHIVRSQVADVAQAEGAPQAGVAATDRALAEAFAVLRAAPSAEAARAPMRASLAAAASGLSRRQQRALLDAFASPWGWTWARIVPAEALAAFDGPVLALFGERDLQVRARDNAAAMVPHLRHGDSRVEILPGLNHLFQPALTGAPSEYAVIETTLDPVAIERVAEFLAAVPVGREPDPGPEGVPGAAAPASGRHGALCF